jgi:hypothetical protein
MNTHVVRTTPRSPWQKAYVERVIGSIRRDCLDHPVLPHRGEPASLDSHRHLLFGFLIELAHLFLLVRRQFRKPIGGALAAGPAAGPSRASSHRGLLVSDEEHQVILELSEVLLVCPSPERFSRLGVESAGGRPAPHRHQNR